MDIFNLWLPLIGGGILIAVAIGAWFSDHKVLGTWFGFAGLVALLFLAALQTHEAVTADQKPGNFSIEDASRRIERAYVTAIQGQVYDFLPGTPTKAQITIKNAGRTPAHDVTNHVLIGVSLFPLDRPPDLPVIITGGPSTLAASQEVYLNPATKRPLTAGEIELIRNGKAALYVIGEVAYADIFGVRHYAKFRLYFGGDHGTRQDGAMAIDKLGNESD